MNIHLLFIFLGCCLGYPLEKPVDYTGHKVMRVIPRNSKQVEFLRDLEQKYELDFWNQPSVSGVPLLMHLSPHVTDAVEELLRKEEINYTITVSDLQRAIELERKANMPLDKKRLYSDTLSHLDFTRYTPWDEISAFLKGVAKEHPNRAIEMEIGRSYENRPILGVKITTDLTNSKPAIVMECGIHSREWISVSVCLYTITELISKYDTDAEIKELVDEYNWYIIPSTNPDGYEYTWSTDRLWRKTRSVNKGSHCKGTDANRNFGEHVKGTHGSRDPCSLVYYGDHPFSESESRAIKELVESLRGQLKIYFSIHSFSQYWMTPYGYKASKPPNCDELRRLSKIGTDALSAIHGTRYEYGTVADIMPYRVAGSSLDWAYEEGNAELAFALELRDTGQFGFRLPEEQIIPTCEETWAGLKAAVKAVQ